MIALLRFHLASGARVALSAAVPLAGILVTGIGLQENPAKVLEQLATWIAGSPPSASALGALAAVGFGLSLWAAPRLTLGGRGWIRHLPLSRSQHTIALIGATACACAPLVAGTLACAVLESGRTGVIAWPAILFAPVVAVATAALAIALRPTGRRRIHLRRLPPRTPLEARIAIRAVGARFVSAWLAGALPLGATFLFVTNNALTPDLAGMGVRLGGTLAATLALAQLADDLAVRRPSWPWARSLPTSAGRRVAGDAVMLGIACAPIIVATAALEPRAAAAVTAALPLLALRASAAMRRGRDSRWAASGPLLIEGAFASGLIALIPWLGVAGLLVLPFAFRAAVSRDRALKVTRWSALAHVAAGDTHSWTA